MVQVAQVKRHEIKYYISSRAADLLALRLKRVLRPDPHNHSSAGYRIKSLYYERYDRADLYTKQSGIHSRKKLRLRIYDETASHAKLEVKLKHNQQIEKRSLLLDRESALQVAAGNYQPLKSLQSESAMRFYLLLMTQGYRPATIVEYWREAYTYPAFNVRITLDRHLHGNCADLELFATGQQHMPVLLSGRQILEVKFNHYLPDFIRHLIQPIPLERAAISKYTLARRHQKHQKWEDQ